MTFATDIVRVTNRVQANLPQAAVGGSSALYKMLAAFLSAKADTDTLITDSSTNMYLLTAQGAALDAKASDFGVTRNLGTPATVSVTFASQIAVTTTVTIPAFTVVSTVGDGLTTIAQVFTTQATTTIPAGSTTSAAVNAVCTASGSAGNIAAGAIAVLITALGGPVVYGVTNAAAATGGTDADTDAVLRSKVLALLLPKYGAASVQQAIIAAGAYDAYVSSAAGAITYYWADSTGAQNPFGTQATATCTVSGGAITTVTVTNGGTGYSTTVAPVAQLSGGGGTGGVLTFSVNGSGVITGYTITAAGTGYSSAPTITILPGQIVAAAVGAIPGGVVATSAPFSLTNYITSSALTVTFTAPIAFQQGTLITQVQTQVAAYLQSLVHGQTPNTYAMGQYVSSTVNGTLLNFACSTTFSTATNTQLYRCTGVPTTVVGVTATWV